MLFTTSCGHFVWLSWYRYPMLILGSEVDGSSTAQGVTATKLIDKKAPRGKFRVIADNFGQWRTTHSDILVGDFRYHRPGSNPSPTRAESPMVRALVGDHLRRQRSHRMTEDRQGGAAGTTPRRVRLRRVSR